MTVDVDEIILIILIGVCLVLALSILLNLEIDALQYKINKLNDKAYRFKKENEGF